MRNTKEIVTAYLGAALCKRLAFLDGAFFEQIAEIRIRADKPLLIYRRGKEYRVGPDGRLLDGGTDAAYRPTQADIGETLEKISQYSLYAFEEELKQGYIALPGGHRVGVTGRAALDRQTVRTLHHINGLNLRVAHQMIGCADNVLPLIIDGGRLCHTLLIAPPGFGKTTLLRDIVRQISDGVPGLCPGVTVGVVDERSEIAGCFRGVAQNDIGIRTDVLDGCPKAEGMVMLLRAMSPSVIAVDELGGERDAKAVEDVLNAGVRLVCTVHGRDLADIRQKPALCALLDKRVFARFVVLRAPGQVAAVYDNDGMTVAGRRRGVC